jgi:hypothetical protein
VAALGATCLSLLLATYSSLSGELRSNMMRTAALESAPFTSAGGALGRICRNTGAQGVSKAINWPSINHAAFCAR